MKNCKFLAIMTAALLLSSCNAGDNGSETTSAAVTDGTSETSALSETVQTTQAANGVTSETTAAATETAAQTTASAHQLAETVQSATASEKTTDEEAVETVPEQETELLDSDGAEVFRDKYTQKDYIMLNITPQKVYWNETDGYDVTVGQAMDIAIPAIFEDWLTDADEIMIYMGELGRNSICDMNLNDMYVTVKGMPYPQYWSTDYLCPIKNGVVCFGEYTDDIKNSFSRVDDGVYIEEANYSYSDNPFCDGMSVENLDMYFETIIKDYNALKEEMVANPDRDYDIAGFWGYQDGVRFRATINSIYTFDLLTVS